MECLPPYGTYPPWGSVEGRFYWTETIASQDGFSVCIPLVFGGSYGLTAECNRDQQRPVRCIRDTP